jgi:hypothetical protein
MANLQHKLPFKNETLHQPVGAINLQQNGPTSLEKVVRTRCTFDICPVLLTQNAPSTPPTKPALSLSRQGGWNLEHGFMKLLSSNYLKPA